MAVATPEILAEVLADKNFSKLASLKTSLETFVELVDQHVVGWTQKRRLLDGLKDLQPKLEAVEHKLVVAKAVGKAKSKLDYDEQCLVDAYSLPDVKAKVSALNTSIQTVIDEGKFTPAEKPVLIAHLQERQNKAKAAGKEAAQEKLEKMIKGVVKVTPEEIPVVNLPQLFNLHIDYEGIIKLQSKKANILTDADKKRLATKDKVWESIQSLQKTSRMWFETSVAFDSRLENAIAVRRVNLAEELKREAEAEAERERLAFAELVEKKKRDEAEKEEQKARAVMEKIEARRKEAQGKPVKAVPKKVVKDKHKHLMNPFELFLEPTQMRELDPGPADDKPPEEDAAVAETAEPSPSASPDLSEEEARPAAAPKKKDPEPEPEVPAPKPKEEPKPKPQPKKERPVLENKWGDVPKLPEELEGVDVADREPTLAEAAKVAEMLEGPSLSEAVKAPKKDKVAPPQPKKKEKKKFAKVNNVELGFEC